MAINEKKYTRYFKAFSDPSRLKIIKLLSGKEMTVNEVARAMGLSQPTISRQLAILREADIVIYRRDGQQVHYSLNKNKIQECCCGFCITLEIPVRTPAGSKKSKK